MYFNVQATDAEGNNSECSLNLWVYPNSGRVMTSLKRGLKALGAETWVAKRVRTFGLVLARKIQAHAKVLVRHLLPGRVHQRERAPNECLSHRLVLLGLHRWRGAVSKKETGT